jgi:hypothetical protein
LDPVFAQTPASGIYLFGDQGDNRIRVIDLRFLSKEKTEEGLARDSINDAPLLVTGQS